MTRSLAVLLALLLGAAASLPAAQPLETAVIGPTAGAPAVASTASLGDRFLTVWLQGGAIFGAFSDHAGNRSSPAAFPVVERAPAERLQLIALDDSFALFWRAPAGGTYYAELDREARVLSRVRLDIAALTFRAAWNGDVFLVQVHESGFGNSAYLVDRSGRIFQKYALTNGVDTHVAALSDGAFLILESGGLDLRALRLPRNGPLSEPVILDRAVSFHRYYPATPSVAALPGGDALIAFVGTTFDQPSQVKTVRLSAIGLITSALNLAVDGYYTIDSLHVAAQGNQYRVFFRGTRDRSVAAQGPYDFVGVPVDETGQPSGSARVVTALPYQSRLVFASNATVTLGVVSPLLASEYIGNTQIEAFALRAPQPVPGEVLSLTASLQDTTAIAANAAGFIAAWNDRIGDDAEVHVATVDPGSGARGPITHLPGSLASARIASGPADHLVLRFTRESAFATRIAHDGRRLADVPLPFFATDAAWTGNGYVLASDAGARIRTFSISGSSVPVVHELALPAPSGSDRGASRIQIASEGAHTLLVFTDTVSEGAGIPGYGTFTHRLLGWWLNANGSPRDAAPFEITSLPDRFPTSLTSGGGQFVLRTLHDGRARIITADGRIGTARPILSGYYSIVDLRWNGDSYDAALRAMNRYAGITRLDRNLNAIEPIGVLATPAGAAAGEPRVAAIGRTRVVVAPIIDPRQQSVRAFAFDDNDLRPLPPPPPAPRIGSISAASDRMTEVTWTPVSGAVDGYAIEVRTGDHFLLVATAGANETSALVFLQPATAQYRVRAFNEGGLSGDGVLTSPDRRRSIRP